jgi:hypothetical protein
MTNATIKPVGEVDANKVALIHRQVEIEIPIDPKDLPQTTKVTITPLQLEVQIGQMEKHRDSLKENVVKIEKEIAQKKELLGKVIEVLKAN